MFHVSVSNFAVVDLPGQGQKRVSWKGSLAKKYKLQDLAVTYRPGTKNELTLAPGEQKWQLQDLAVTYRPKGYQLVRGGARHEFRNLLKIATENPLGQSS